jgi:prepilin-type N-terminal cleavage/methylation domain-containing protein
VTRNESGFTLVEVLMAVIVLSIGVTALVGSSAMVTRMVGRGRSETLAAQAATQRMDSLRVLAYSTATHCTAGAFASGGPTTTNGIRERWIVSIAGKVASVSDTVTHRVARGTHTDILTARIEC